MYDVRKTRLYRLNFTITWLARWLYPSKAKVSDVFWFAIPCFCESLVKFMPKTVCEITFLWFRLFVFVVVVYFNSGKRFRFQNLTISLRSWHAKRRSRFSKSGYVTLSCTNISTNDFSALLNRLSTSAMLVAEFLWRRCSHAWFRNTMLRIILRGTALSVNDCGLQTGINYSSLICFLVGFGKSDQICFLILETECNARSPRFSNGFEE